MGPRTDRWRPRYRLFLMGRRFLRVGTSEKDVEVLNAGSIGALTVILVRILPAGVSVVLVRMRMVVSPIVLARPG